jgi:enoyl-[acyl-carrier protein] reductase I
MAQPAVGRAQHPFSLAEKVGIVAGLANEDSIAFGCACALHSATPQFIASDAGATITGITHDVDAGHHIRF